MGPTPNSVEETHATVDKAIQYVVDRSLSLSLPRSKGMSEAQASAFHV